MPLFGKRKREPELHTAEQEKLLEAATHLLAMRRLWLDGQLDLAIRGSIEEGQVFAVMSDVHQNWLRVAAMAWDGHGKVGRGYISLDNGGTRRLDYHTPDAATGDSPLPRETVHYCASYNPATELVFAIYGFPREGDPAACASLWIRPPATWESPPVAWKKYVK
jgi:hypothetical protein